MKTIFTTAAALLAIILIRMTLSFTISEPAAELFTQVSVTAVFFLAIFRAIAIRRTAAR